MPHSSKKSPHKYKSSKWTVGPSLFPGPAAVADNMTFTPSPPSYTDDTFSQYIGSTFGQPSQLTSFPSVPISMFSSSSSQPFPTTSHFSSAPNSMFSSSMSFSYSLSQPAPTSMFSSSSFSSTSSSSTSSSGSSFVQLSQKNDQQLLTEALDGASGAKAHSEAYKVEHLIIAIYEKLLRNDRNIDLHYKQFNKLKKESDENFQRIVPIETHRASMKKTSEQLTSEKKQLAECKSNIAKIEAEILNLTRHNESLVNMHTRYNSEHKNLDKNIQDARADRIKIDKSIIAIVKSKPEVKDRTDDEKTMLDDLLKRSDDNHKKIAELKQKIAVNFDTLSRIESTHNTNITKLDSARQTLGNLKQQCSNDAIQINAKKSAQVAEELTNIENAYKKLIEKNDSIIKKIGQLDNKITELKKANEQLQAELKPLEEERDTLLKAAGLLTGGSLAFFDVYKKNKTLYEQLSHVEKQ